MKELTEILSSYDLFNNLLPGVVFVGVVNELTSFQIEVENIAVGAFLCYFIGLIISRIGSLILVPFLQCTWAVHFAPYSDYIKAAKKDSKIDLLSEVNNTYRSLASLTLVIIGILLFELFTGNIEVFAAATFLISCLGIFLLLIMSHRKHTKYIVNRIKVAIKK